MASTEFIARNWRAVHGRAYLHGGTLPNLTTMTATEAVLWGYSLMYHTASDDDARTRLEEWVQATDLTELKAKEQQRRRAAVAALGGVLAE